MWPGSRHLVSHAKSFGFWFLMVPIEYFVLVGGPGNQSEQLYYFLLHLWHIVTQKTAMDFHDQFPLHGLNKHNHSCNLIPGEGYKQKYVSGMTSATHNFCCYSSNFSGGCNGRENPHNIIPLCIWHITSTRKSKWSIKCQDIVPSFI